jgi:hypothetical protein
MRSRPPQGIPITSPKDFLEQFAKAFVEPDFRERFVHEAIKKPERLATRICHSIEEIFPPSYAGNRSPFNADDLCVPISGTNSDFQQFRWSDLAFYIDRGAGILIASAQADSFYAETETQYRSPYRIYASPTP